MNLRAIPTNCGHCESTFDVSIVGLAATSDVICPVCGEIFRFSRQNVRDFRKRWNKASWSIRKLRPEVLKIRAELDGAQPLPEATILWTP